MTAVVLDGRGQERCAIVDSDVQAVSMLDESSSMFLPARPRVDLVLFLAHRFWSLQSGETDDSLEGMGHIVFEPKDML